MERELTICDELRPYFEWQTTGFIQPFVPNHFLLTYACGLHKVSSELLFILGSSRKPSLCSDTFALLVGLESDVAVDVLVEVDAAFSLSFLDVLLHHHLHGLMHHYFSSRS